MVRTRSSSIDISPLLKRENHSNVRVFSIASSLQAVFNISRVSFQVFRKRSNTLPSRTVYEDQTCKNDEHTELSLKNRTETFSATPLGLLNGMYEWCSTPVAAEFSNRKTPPTTPSLRLLLDTPSYILAFNLFFLLYNKIVETILLGDIILSLSSACVIKTLLHISLINNSLL